MGHTEGGNRREEDRLPRLEGAEWQGLLSCLQWKGGKNRRQNLRFFVPHHSPYILHSNGAQTALSSGQVLGTRISSQVGDLPKGEDKITKRDKITCPDKMMAQCGTTLLSGLGGQTWQALVVPTVAQKTVTLCQSFCYRKWLTTITEHIFESDVLPPWPPHSCSAQTSQRHSPHGSL